MPKRFTKRTTKSSTKKKYAGTKVRRGGRRLGGVGFDMPYVPETGAKYVFKKYENYLKIKKRREGRKASRFTKAGPSGMPVPDAANGSAGGFRVGKKKSMGVILERRKKKVLDVLADARYPVIKNHALNALPQLDWPAGAQGVLNLGCGYNTTELGPMMTQALSAGSVSTASYITPVNNLVNVNNRMDIYDKTTKFNFKNTCSHTVYLEVEAFNCKGIHGFTMESAWQASLNADDMYQNPLTFGTEQLRYDIGNRPDFRLADLNVRWKKQAGSKFKIALEPGQETSYTFIQPGMRFDQQRFNVQQGSSASPVDATYAEGLTSQLMIYARAEMVTDAIDTDVTYGSGHLAINSESWHSWSAVPYVKPLQSSFQNAWGTIVEANEQDLNQYQANNDPYEEQV